MSNLNDAIDIFWAAATVATGGHVPRALSWVTAFTPADRTSMCDELKELVQAAVEEICGWNLVDEAIHEWRESAAAMGAS